MEVRTDSLKERKYLVTWHEHIMAHQITGNWTVPVTLGFTSQRARNAQTFLLMKWSCKMVCVIGVKNKNENYDIFLKKLYGSTFGLNNPVYNFVFWISILMCYFNASYFIDHKTVVEHSWEWNIVALSISDLTGIPQKCCRDACQISEGCDDFKTQYRGFEI